jgi:hypothetical protein
MEKWFLLGNKEANLLPLPNLIELDDIRMILYAPHITSGKNSLPGF